MRKLRPVVRAVARHESTAGMGFFGATGIFASSLTDLASVLGPALPVFCVLAAVVVVLATVQIHRREAVYEQTKVEPPGMARYCHVFLVAIGSLFGTGMLVVCGLFVDDSSDSTIIALLTSLQASVERVETKVDQVDDTVRAVGEDVRGIGKGIDLIDISGRSGTGMIGDTATFKVAMANNSLMTDARCLLQLAEQWRPLVTVLDESCDQFTVQLPTAALLDANGHSLGDVVPIPFQLEVLDESGSLIVSYENTYPFQNQYRTLNVVLEPAGNRLKLNERRRARVDVGPAELSDALECDWNVVAPLSFEPTSANRCEGWLSTEADPNSYPVRKLREDGEMRDTMYVQLNSASDFTMFGITEFRYSLTPD